MILTIKSLSLISILFSFSILYVKRRHNTIGVITREAFSSSAMYDVSRIYTATESKTLISITIINFRGFYQQYSVSSKL